MAVRALARSLVGCDGFCEGPDEGPGWGFFSRSRQVRWRGEERLARMALAWHLVMVMVNHHW